MENINYWIWLSQLDLCPENAIKYLEKYTINQLWNSKEEEINKFFTKEEINRILCENYRQKITMHAEYMKKYGIKLITYNDSYYPEKLKNIKNPPLALYVIGNLELLNKRQLAIVGARKCTEYGRTVAQAFSYLLAKNKFVITSGFSSTSTL